MQCTKGKCPKAFHVNCARDGHSMGIVFAVVRELEKEVILLGSAPSTIRNDTGFTERACINAPGTDSQAGMSRASAPAVAAFSPQPHVPKIIKKLEVQILCTQHNPVCLFPAFRHLYGMLSFVVCFAYHFPSSGCGRPEESEQRQQDSKRTTGTA